MTIESIIVTAFISLKSFCFAKEQDKMLHLQLSIPVTNTIMKQLYKLPYEEAVPIIDDIRQQVIPQLQDTTELKK